jgi:hypothetical protein
MPEPFRLFLPPPEATEKLLLTQSGKLFLAISVNNVQEVLLKVPVIKHQNKSATIYKDNYIPVMLGYSACPPVAKATLVLMQTDALKCGLIAIASQTIPKLVAISNQDWTSVPALEGIWQTDGKGYILDNITYAYITGLAAK